MSHSTSTPMRALIAPGPNAPFQATEVPRPQAGPGQVLVRIRASGINPLDSKIRAAAAPHARQPLPAVLGLDMAGTVVAVGPNVSAFKEGDDVYGLVGGVGGRQGTMAEYIAVEANLLALKPASLTMREAAALPLVFITAWEGLVDRAAVRPGQAVLVQGGGGGVGHVAIQLARAYGAEVWATDRTEKADLIRAYGATPIDFTAATVADYVADHTAGAGFDLVYDTGGGPVLDASFAAVKRFGHVVSCLGWGTHALAPLSFRAGTYSGVFTLHPMLTGEGLAHHGEILSQAARLVEAGKLRPQVASQRFALDQADDAFRLLEGGGADGKIVLEVS